MSKIKNYQKDSDVLKALGHPLRLKIIVGLISHGECNVKLIVEELKIPQSTASQHLGILKSKEIIESRKEGVKTCYRVVDQRVYDIIRILER
jgi:ArsR family transcriptional regulator